MARSRQAWSVTTGVMWVMPFNPLTLSLLRVPEIKIQDKIINSTM